MFDLTAFSTLDMMQFRSLLRNLRDEPSESMEDAAGRIAGHLYDDLRIGLTDERACVLVRIFKTHTYADFDDDLREAAQGATPGQRIPENTKCLTLLATRGSEPAWNSRKSSSGHRAIPLVSEPMVEKAPMIARLFGQLGIPVRSVLRPERDFIMKAQEKTFNVFHIPEAIGSAFVPAQEEFVLPYGVRSVLGFGGVFPSGDLFATILFTRISIPVTTAELFSPLALNVKICLLPFDRGRTFNAEKA